MTDIVSFPYPDHGTAELCEQKARSIRRTSRLVLEGIVTIGRGLIEVKQMLGHGLFLKWLDFHFRWSPSTAENFMNAARAVSGFPKLWEFDPSILYLFTKRLPARTKEEIVREGPMSVDEARAIISRHRAEDWRQVVEELVATDPGMALHEMEIAMLDDELRDAAEDALKAHAEDFAILSDREPQEILAEVGVTFDKRIGRPAAGRVSATLYESADGCRLVIWARRKPIEIAVFPTQRDDAGREWQAKIMDACVEVTGARVAFDSFAQLL